MSSGIVELNSCSKTVEFHSAQVCTAYDRRMVAEWGQRLRALLDERDWNVPDLAREMGRAGDQALENLLYKYTRGEVQQPRRPMMANIARAFGISEARLREEAATDEEEGTPEPQSGSNIFISYSRSDPEFAKLILRELDIRAGRSGAGLPSEEFVVDGDHADAVKSEAWIFPPTFVLNELHTVPANIIIIETQGDSMTPTIDPGERVVIDTRHKLPTPDGIYALRDRFGAIQVKRLHVMRGRSETPIIRVISDNQHHPSEDVRPDDIEIVGRVVCALKRF